MSGIASAALTMPGSVAPLASCSSAASLRIWAISAASATTSAGTRIPGFASGGMRQRYGPTGSIFMTSSIVPGSAGGDGRRAAMRPRDAQHGDDDAGDASELRHAVGAEPEAVEPQRLDGEPSDRVEPEIREEERAGARAQPRAERDDEHEEDREVPE